MMTTVCECHGEPTYWDKDARYKAGGHWRCSVKIKAKRKRRYEGDVEHREQLRARSREKYRERRGLVAKIKLDRGCSECGYDAHPAALEFHHLDPSTKKFTIGQSISKRDISELLDEIEKCVVLCANCHRVRHNEEAYGD